MTLKVGSTGFATAYASLPIGTFEDEAKRIRRKVRLWHKAHPDDPQPISEPDIVYLLGQADLAAQIRVGDFRDVFDIRYPTGECNATTVNWVFSVGLDLPQLDLKTRPGAEFQYLLHLRYRRSIFAYENAEEECVRRIIELAREHELISSVQVAMGWSDLIVEGSFSNDTHKDLTRFIIGVHGIHMIILGKKTPVFDRMLTIMGYPDDEPPPDYDHGHMMFVRALPGKYDAIAATLKPLGALHILDGKADFIENTLKTQPNFLKEQRRLTGEEGRGIFQKIDTHLMYGLAAEYERVAKESALCAGIENERLHHHCVCHKKAKAKYRELRRLLFAARRTALPQEHFYSIENMLFLLGGALKDRSGCCDVRDPVLACYDALETILWSLLEKWHEPLPPVNVNEATRKRQMDIAVSYRRIDEWHRFAEVLLRQRTIGSFEEFLGHTDRAVVYSGGVQKFLYLADRLINDFAQSVDRELPHFSTIYDSVKTIVSRAGVGLVHIPTRNIFQLPLAVADLWHEVGTVLFAEEVLDRLKPPKERDFIANLADSFGDIVVYLFGFAGDFDKFVASFAWATTEAYGDGDDRSVGPYAVGQFLTRVYLVFELHKLRELARTGRGREVRTDNEETIRQTISSWIGELYDHWMERYTNSRRYGKKITISKSQWIDLYRNAIHPNFKFFRSLYERYVLRPVDTRRPSVTSFENDGKIVPISHDHDLNAYFGEAAYMIQAPDAEPMNSFLLMASLGKSATNECHRRQATVRAH